MGVFLGALVQGSYVFVAEDPATVGLQSRFSFVTRWLVLHAVDCHLFYVAKSKDDPDDTNANISI